VVDSRDEPPSTDALLAAFAISICDVIAAQIGDTRTALMALDRKGLLSSSEWQQAKNEIPPEVVGRISQELQGEVQKRVLAILQGQSDQGTVQ
jgi:hypothetical protein